MLWERESITLAEMKNDTMKLEVNMDVEKMSKVGKGRVKEEKQPSTSSDGKFDTMVKTMEGLMDRIALENNNPPTT